MIILTVIIMNDDDDYNISNSIKMFWSDCE